MSSFEEIIADFDSLAPEPVVNAEFKGIIELAQSINERCDLKGIEAPIDSEQMRTDIRNLNARWQAYRERYHHDITVTGDVYLGAEYIRYAESIDDEFLTYCSDNPTSFVHYPVIGGMFAAAYPREAPDSNPRIVFFASIATISEDEEVTLHCAIDLDTIDFPLEGDDELPTAEDVGERFLTHFNFVKFSIAEAADVCEATLRLKDAVVLPYSEQSDELEEYRCYLNEYLSHIKYNEFIPYIVEVRGAYEESDFNTTTFNDREFIEAACIVLSQPELTAGSNDEIDQIFLRGRRLHENRTTTIRVPLGSVQDIKDTAGFYRDFLKE